MTGVICETWQWSASDPKSDSSLARRLFGSLLSIDGGLLAHGGENDDVYTKLAARLREQCVYLTGVLAILLEELLDLVANLTIRNLDIIFGITIVGHEGEEVVVGDVELCHRSDLDH